MSSKLILRNKSASIISRDKEYNFYCFIVVLFGLFICFNCENECTAEQFVAINVKNMRKLISAFGKTLDVVFYHYFFSLSLVP